MAASEADHAAGEAGTKQGPANPQGTDQDAPSPPGGPLRSDRPSGSVAPGEPGGPGRSGGPAGPPQPEGGSMRHVEEPVGPPAKEATVPEDPEKLSRNQPSDDTEEH